MGSVGMVRVRTGSWVVYLKGLTNLEKQGCVYV